MRLLLILFIVTSTAVLGAEETAKINLPQKVRIDEVLLKKNLEISKADKKTASNIESIYKMVEANFLSAGEIAKLHLEIKKNKTFKDYFFWINHLKNLEKLKTQKEISSYCEKNIFELKNNFLSENLKKGCINLYLEKFTNSKNQEITFFKSHISEILKYSNNIVPFLEKISEDEKNFITISNIITNYYLKLGEKPDQELVSRIYLSPEFLKFIQFIGLNSSSYPNVFLSEFNLYRNNLINKIDRGEVSNIKVALKELKNYYELSLDKLPKESVFESYLSLGKSLSRREFYEEAESTFLIALGTKNEGLKEKVYFEIIWNYFQNNDEKKMALFLQEKNLIKNFKKIEDPKLLFWISKSIEKKDKKKSLEILGHLISTFPLSYYAIISTKILKDKSSSLDTLYELIPENTLEQSYISHEVLSLRTLNKLKRIRVWSNLSSFRFLNYELSSIFDLNNDASFVLLISKILKNERDYLNSFKIIYKNIYNKKLVLTKDLLRVLYPKPFWESLNNNKNNVDPYLSLSLIRQESGFNPDARSRVGARGLMQLMPDTARRFNKKITTGRLHDPFTNIKLGTKYLANLLKRYDSNIVRSLAAYNAGEGRVDRWEKEYFKEKEVIKNIENIPFAETRKYVKLIFRNMFFYKFLDDERSEGEQLGYFFNDLLQNN